MRINTETEIWATIPEFPKYQISNMGRVKSLGNGKTRKEKLMKASRQTNGYERIRIHLNGTEKSFYIHRLVAQAFIPNPYNNPVVNHKNSIRDDNRFENLEWCTYSENTQHGYEVGNVVCKVSNLQVNEIRERYKAGGITQIQLGKEYGVHNSHISAIILNQKRNNIQKPTLNHIDLFFQYFERFAA